MPVASTDCLRRRLDYVVLPSIRHVGRSVELNMPGDVSERIGKLRRQLFDCLEMIEGYLFSEQPETVRRGLLSLRSTIYHLLSSLPPVESLDHRFFEEAHRDLQLEPIMSPPSVESIGVNRISRWI